MRVKANQDVAQSVALVEAECSFLRQVNTELFAILQPHAEFPIDVHNVINAVQVLIEQKAALQRAFENITKSHHDLPEVAMTGLHQFSFSPGSEIGEWSTNKSFLTYPYDSAISNPFRGQSKYSWKVGDRVRVYHLETNACLIGTITDISPGSYGLPNLVYKLNLLDGTEGYTALDYQLLPLVARQSAYFTREPPLSDTSSSESIQPTRELNDVPTMANKRYETYKVRSDSDSVCSDMQLSRIDLESDHLKSIDVSKQGEFHVGSRIEMQHFLTKEWVPGIVLCARSNHRYRILLDNGTFEDFVLCNRIRLLGMHTSSADSVDKVDESEVNINGNCNKNGSDCAADIKASLPASLHCSVVAASAPASITTSQMEMTKAACQSALSSMLPDDSPSPASLDYFDRVDSFMYDVPIVGLYKVSDRVEVMLPGAQRWVPGTVTHVYSYDSDQCDMRLDSDVLLRKVKFHRLRPIQSATTV